MKMNQNSKAIIFHVEVNLHKAFQNTCKKRGHLMSGVLRELIREYIKKNIKKI